MAPIPKIAQDRIANELYEVAARARDKTRYYLGMSEIGKLCDRQLWYNFRSFTPEALDGRIIMLFRFGDRIEEEVIYHLKQVYRVEGQQKVFSAHNGFFRGHCDGIIYGVTQQPHILEIKSANKKKFESFKKFGVRKTYPVYYSQCQCYMGYSGLERAIVVVQCKDTSEIYTERIYFNRSDFQALHDRAKDIIFSNEIPGKIEDDWECQWCSQRINCFYPDEAIMEDRVCGNCYYFGWPRNSCKGWCFHPDHHFKIEQWGVGCPDWIFVFTKELIEKKRIPLGAT